MDPRELAKRLSSSSDEDFKEGALIPAATVVLLRDCDSSSGAAIEVLMLRKSSKIAFGGMWVFPGGRVDAQDVDPDDPFDEVAAARRAAAREAAEEARVSIDPRDLVPFSHWTPPPQAPRRYATWFFLACATSDEVKVDMGEIHEFTWMSPATALLRHASGEIELAPPTWVTLHGLSSIEATEHALEMARSKEPERFVTRIAIDGNRMAAVWEGDAAYESNDLEVPGKRHRLWMDSSSWLYERS